MGTPAADRPSLEDLAAAVRQHAGLTGKAPIGSITEFVDASDPVRGPGDDGAVVAVGDDQVVVCGEALFPPFVASDPYGAGIAAVLANVNDVAAMGGVPSAVVNTVVAPADIATEAMRGMRDAARMYDVPLVGGHLTRHDGEPALSAFAIGSVRTVLSMANVAPDQDLVFVCSLDGHMRADFPFFTSLDRQGPRLARDVRLLARAADEGLAVAAKDVSMAGPIGSLAMLLEYREVGATVDLRILPSPTDSPLARWLVCFPTYAFWLTTSPARSAACVELFRSHGLDAEVVGRTTADPVLYLVDDRESVAVVDLSRTPVTGLWTDRD